MIVVRKGAYVVDLNALERQRTELRLEIVERLLFLHRPDFTPFRLMDPDDPGRALYTELERQLEEKRAQLRELDTGPRTAGYHPEPSMPTFAGKGETASFGVLQQVQPSVAYLFETGVKTEGGAGIVAWWKDADNCAYDEFLDWILTASLVLIIAALLA